MTRLGQLLAAVDRIPSAVEDIHNVSAPDFSLVASRLEHAARRVRVLAECHDFDRHDRVVLDAMERERSGPAPDTDPFFHLTGGRP